MTKQELQEIINDDEFGLLDLPVLTRDEQAMVDAFVPFLKKYI